MSLRETLSPLPFFPRINKEQIKGLINHRLNDSSNRIKRYKFVYFLSDLVIHFNNPRITHITSLDSIPVSRYKKSLFFIHFDTDDDLLEALKTIKKHGGHFLCLPIWTKTRYCLTNKLALRALHDSYQNRQLTSHWNLDIHETITQALDLTKNVPGCYLEIGVYKGGSALTAMNYLKHSGDKRAVYLLDTFDGFNYPEAQNSFDIHWVGTHRLSGVQKTIHHLRTNVFDKVIGEGIVPYELIPCNICRDPLPVQITQISCCNIDVDMYEATLAALMAVAPKIPRGGIIICEDPTSTPGLGGALLAMTQFLESESGKDFKKIFVPSQYLLLKT